MAIAVVVQPRAASTPANLFIVNARLAGDIGKCAVTVVVKQDVVSPEAAEEIVPAIVVVIAHAYAGLPTRAGEAGFFRDVGESSIAVIFVQMRGGSFAWRPIFVEAGSVCQINIEPAVVVVIEKSQATAFGFDDVLFVIDSAPDVRGI